MYISSDLDVLEHAFGTRGKTIAFVAIIMFTFGALCAYCVLVGDFFLHVFDFWDPDQDFEILHSRPVITIIFASMMLGLCLLKNLDSLKYTSILAVCCVGYTVMLLLFSEWGEMNAFNPDQDFFHGIPHSLFRAIRAGYHM